MHLIHLVAALATAYLQADVALAQNVSNIVCDAGLHVIVARGSGAAPGTGKMGAVADKIVAAVPNSTIAPLDYPATMPSSFQDIMYIFSVVAGVVSLANTIREYTGKCPGGKIALLGNSQGGQVVSQTLCGPNTTSIYMEMLPLDPKYTKNVVGVILFRDPTHVPGVSWDVGTSTENGVFHSTNITGCAPYASRIRSFCDKGDPACDAGTEDAVHESYFAKYGQDAADFVVSKFKESMAA